MDKLEEAKILEQEILDEIDDLKEQLVDLRELMADLSAEASGNPYWTAPDELGGMLLKPMQEIKAILEAGNRAEQYYAKAYKPFHLKLFATITEDVSPQNLKWYSEAQTRLFPQLIVGRGLTFAPCKDEDGNWIEGYAIPWWGNYGPYNTTMRLQDDWTSPSKLSRVKDQAARNMRNLDRMYRLAGISGGKAEFMRRFPHYEPV